ncbi:MAG: branched-chain amino acid ABC transporter permease [Halorientalis sp.]
MSEDTRTTGIRSRLDPRSLPLRQQLGLLGLGFLAALPLLVDLPVVGPLVMTVLPAETPLLAVYKVTGALFFAMFVVSWDFVSGYTGEISFGHGLFFGVGAYTSALLNLGHGVSPWLSVPAGVVLAAVAGVLIGVPSLRLEGPYLSLVTLVAPLILVQLFVVFSGIFGGELGLSNPQDLVGAGVVANYFLAFVLFVAILALTWAVTRSNTGDILTAIREDTDAVSAAGLNPAKFKIFAFVVSAAIGGLAGAVYVHTPNGSPTPSELLTVIVNVEVIIAAILGGMGTISGAAVGGLVIALLPSYLDLLEVTVPMTGQTVADMSFFIFAVITLALLFVFPGGLLRWGIGLGGRVVGSDEPADVAPDGGRSAVGATVAKYRASLRRLLGGEEE